MLRGSLPGPQVLARDPYLERLEPAFRQMIVEQPLHSGADLQRLFLHILRGSKALTFAGDKDTEYVRYLPHLQKLFPEARFIHIYRDPRDVVASRLKTEWGQKRSLAFHAGEYHYYLQKVQAEGATLLGGHFIEVAYEQLLAAPERELRRLCDFLQLPFEPACLEFHRNSNQVITASEKAWKGNLDKPLMAQNHGKWREQITDKQAALLQLGLEGWMEEQGYDLLAAQPRLSDRLIRVVVKQMFRLKTYFEKPKARYGLD